MSYDSKGNLTSDPTTGKTYGYSSENLLTSASGGVTLGYDPALRLYQVAGASTTRFAYDGTDMIAEYNASNVLQRRFVFGPGIDNPIVQYEGSGTTTPRFLSSDERGSIISLSTSTGAMLNINRYDEYGKPQSTNVGRFQYTGQMWLNEVGAYYYKARMYLPHLGRFMQTDPIGYGNGPNLYAYVGNDPVNAVDPMGLTSVLPCNPVAVGGSCDPVPVTGTRSECTPGWSCVEPGDNNTGNEIVIIAEPLPIEVEATEDPIVIIGTQLAQAVIPVPRRLSPIPWLYYNRSGGGRRKPPRSNDPNSTPKPKKQCDIEYQQNSQQCSGHFPRLPFPSRDMWGVPRALCYAEATRVYSECLAGRNPDKPFDPTLFYEEGSNE